MKDFLKNDEGNVTVAFSLLVPLLLFYFLWIVSTWQARYVQLQTKAVIDFAVLGGATTGIALETNGSYSGTYIPIYGDEYGAYNEYGSDVATELLSTNAYNTLPKSVADQLVDQARGYWQTADEIFYQQGGYMHFRAEDIKYRSLLPVLVDNWNFTIESTARCQAE